MARDLFVASLALGVDLVIGLKRPLQGKILPSSRLPLNGYVQTRAQGATATTLRGHI